MDKNHEVCLQKNDIFPIKLKLFTETPGIQSFEFVGINMLFPCHKRNLFIDEAIEELSSVTFMVKYHDRCLGKIITPLLRQIDNVAAKIPLDWFWVIKVIKYTNTPA